MRANDARMYQALADIATAYGWARDCARGRWVCGRVEVCDDSVGALRAALIHYAGQHAAGGGL